MANIAKVARVARVAIVAKVDKVANVAKVAKVTSVATETNFLLEKLVFWKPGWQMVPKWSQGDPRWVAKVARVAKVAKVDPGNVNWIYY